jgi:hypothetical protein
LSNIGFQLLFLKNQFYFKFFRPYDENESERQLMKANYKAAIDENESLSELMKAKYKAAIDLHENMFKRKPQIRQNCKQILEIKDLWALNKEELEISDELKKIIDSKVRENELTVYSMLR